MVCLGILFGCKRSRSPTDYLLSALLLIAILSSLRLLCYLLPRLLHRRRPRHRHDPTPDPSIELPPQTDVADHLHQPTPFPDNKQLPPPSLLLPLPSSTTPRHESRSPLRASAADRRRTSSPTNSSVLDNKLPLPAFSR